MSDAIPLPPHPHLDHYRKQAKDLLKACRSNAVRAWATRWVQGLSAREVERIAQHAQEAKIARLADAQFFLARAHGFESWPKFAKHIEALRNAESADAKFEAAAEAIVSGDVATLRRLLHEDSSLIHRRSTRTHRSTLLHYVSANGIEDFRQKTPPNIVEIATVLLDAGADVNAESDAYGGHSTPLGLVATSVHPERAGAQIALMELLLARGARIDPQAVNACVANGRLVAARFLATRGEPLDLIGAAGIGRADVVSRLLDEGADPATEYGGMTAMHWAAHYGHLEVIRVFVAHDAPLEIENRHGGTVLGQAVWSAINDPQPDHLRILETLVAAGAKVGEDWFTGRREIDEALGKT
ncbi:MAG: ankyrin repeat domain-containing protein [Thermoanaerobaculia bacterium]